MLWWLWWYIISWKIEPISEDPIEDVRENNTYNFINPLLECENNTIWNIQKYIPFESDIQSEIKKIQSKNPNTQISIYFRNLRNGPWIGINENITFSPASLMKLPILYMYLKWQDTEPDILERSIIPTSPNTLKQEFEPESKIIIGKEYKISELLYHLIVYSDNTASNTLIAYVPKKIQNQIYEDLFIPTPDTMDYSISVKDYASFFRILYNASYLSRKSSEIALELLSIKNFTGWIRANIPDNVKIAHKFGERKLIENNKEINQLHDCGIVYYEKYPYLLCVMTRSESSLNELSKVIQDISNVIYRKISETYPEKQ